MSGGRTRLGRWSAALAGLLTGSCVTTSVFDNADLSGSLAESALHVLAADGVDAATVRVKVATHTGRVLPGLRVTARCDDCQVTQPATVTDEGGRVSLQVRSLTEGRRVIKLRVSLGDFAADLPTPLTLDFVTLLTQTQVLAGEPFSLAMLARLDGAPFAGTVHVRTGDMNATLPPDVHLDPNAYGYSTLGPIVLRGVGAQTVQALEATNGTVLYERTLQVVGAGVTSLRLANVPAQWTAGTAQAVQAQAVDAFGNPVPSYTGTVLLASSDANAQLPPAHTFDAHDRGVFTWEVVALRTSGTQTLAAGDAARAYLSSQPTVVQVHAGPPAALFATPLTTLTAGTAAQVNISVRDALGNAQDSATVALQLATPSPGAHFPSAYTMTPADRGTVPLTFVFSQSGDTQIVVQAPDWGLSATLPVHVQPGRLFALDLAGAPSRCEAGTPLDLVLSARDAAGNTIDSYLGVLAIGSTDPQAVLPVPSTRAVSASDDGVLRVQLQLRTAGLQQVSFTDLNSGLVAQQNILVQPQTGVTQLTLDGVPSALTAGQAFAVNARATDSFGNRQTDYAGTVHVSSSDPQAALPSDQAAVGGVLTFPGLALRSSGAQSVTLTDTAQASLNATQGNIWVAAAEAQRLQFVQSPAAGLACSPLAQSRVRAVDAFGNAAALQGNVRVTLQASGRSAALGGTVLQPAVGQVAQFADLSVTQPGTYALRASAPGLTLGQSAAMVVTDAGPSVSIGSAQQANNLVTIAFTVATQCPAALEVEYDPNSSGVYRGAYLVGGDRQGNLRNGSHSVVWDAAHDLPNLNLPGVQARLTVRNNNGTGNAATTLAYAGAPAPTPQTLPIAAASCLKFADVTADGIPDLLSCDPANSRLWLSRGARDGSLGTPVAYAAGLAATSLAVGDINRDGRQDVLVGAATGAAWLPGSVGGFGAAQALTLASNLARVALADINRDGTLDALAINSGANVLAYAANNGSGTFAAPSTVACGSAPRDLAVADLNTDGKPDALVLRSDGTMGLLKGTGSGFAAATAVPSGLSTGSAVALADVDRNGSWDVVAAGGSLLSVSLCNLLAGCSLLGTTSVGSPVTGLVLTDLDSNGQLDALISGSASQVAVLMGDGAGHFAAGGLAALGTPSALAVAAADVDGDNRMDVATSNVTSVTAWHSGLPRSQPRHLRLSSTTEAPSRFETYDLGDFDGDGRIDLLLASAADSRMQVWRNSGTGGFAAQGNVVRVAGSPTAPLAADFNGDGCLDAAAANQSSSTVSVLLGDCAGNLGKPLRMFVGGVPTDLAAADVNGDGAVDLVAAPSDGDAVMLMAGDGRGGFGAAVPWAAMNSPGSLQLQDIDGDGIVDLVASSVAALSISAWHSDGSGNLTSLGTGLTGALSSTAFLLAPMDDDGRPDLVGRLITPVGNAFRTQVALNQGAGTFAASPPQDWAGNYGNNFINESMFTRAADINRDGNMDLLVSHHYIRGDGLGNLYGDVQLNTEGDVRGVDLNNDGWLDIVSVDTTGTHINVFTNDGRGNIDAPSLIAYSLGADAVVGDFDHSGAPDVIVGSSCRTFYGTGTALVHGSDLANCGGHGWTSSAAADVDNNGWGDLIVTGYSENLVSTFLSGAGGLFAQSANTTVTHPSQAVLADVTRDGKADLLVRSDNTVRCLNGVGDGTFTGGTNLLVNAYGAFVLGDIDRNGTLDVVAIGGTGLITKLLSGTGAPSGGTAANASLALGNVRNLALADVNRDGAPDVLATTDTGLAVALGDGTGSFGTFVVSDPNDTLQPLSVADFTGDGIADVLTGTTASALLLQGRGDGTFVRGDSYFFNVGRAFNPMTAHGDFDRDGVEDGLLWDAQRYCCSNPLVQLGVSR